MTSTVFGNISVDIINIIRSFFSGNVNRANPYPTKQLDIVVNAAVGTTSSSVFNKNLPKLKEQVEDLLGGFTIL